MSYKVNGLTTSEKKSGGKRLQEESKVGHKGLITTTTEILSFHCLAPFLLSLFSRKSLSGTLVLLISVIKVLIFSALLPI